SSRGVLAGSCGVMHSSLDSLLLSLALLYLVQWLARKKRANYLMYCAKALLQQDHVKAVLPLYLCVLLQQGYAVAPVVTLRGGPGESDPLSPVLVCASLDALVLVPLFADVRSTLSHALLVVS